ncbi:MAG: MoaD/ThiS family protein [Clostridiales Family XIII bacterium]|jgi:molybdopterin converting factor small subunit|nr:MoaD/ThiS family protein [Clostridiales Family XIII bacterium]
MEVNFKLIGTMKFIATVDGKSEVTREIPDGGTVEDALRAIGIDRQKTAQFQFAAVNGKKVELDYVLQPGDTVKVFPRSFGG